MRRESKLKITVRRLGDANDREHDGEKQNHYEYIDCGDQNPCASRTKRRPRDYSVWLRFLLD